MKIPRYCFVGLLMLTAVTAGGCGYSNKSMYPEDVRTVAVDIPQLGKNIYRRDLEMQLAEAIVKRIELDTPYKVTKKDRADTLLESTIDDVSQRALSLNPDTGLPRDMEITMTVSITWTDLRQDRVRVHHQNIRASGTYINPDLINDQPVNNVNKPPVVTPTKTAPGPFSEDFFQGSEDVINRLALKIVEELESN
jgi:hypothetical protein